MSAIIEKPLITEQKINPWPGFWALVRKEIKLYILWSILGLVVMSIGLAYQITRPTLPSVDDYLINTGNYYPVWNRVFRLLDVTCMNIALLLAATQFMRDNNPNLQAFVLHRPIQPRAIFWSKAVAGLTLYLFATSIPLIGFAFWARQPGHLAGPFDIQLLLAPMGLILLGMAAYFAGTTIQSLGWICFLSIALYTVLREDFSAVLCIDGIAIILLAVAAQSSYSAQRVFKKQRLIGKVAFGTMKYIAIFNLCLLVMSLAIGTSSESISGPTYEAAEHGQTVLCTGYDFGSLEITNRLGGGASKMELPFQNVAYEGHSYNYLYSLYMFPQHYVIPIPSKDHSVAWYYSRSQRQIFEYSLATNQQKGVLGPNGFYLPNGHRAGLFPHSFETIIDPMAGNSLMVFKDRTYWIDTTTKQVRAVAIPAQPYSAGPTADAAIGNAFLAITQGRFIAADKNGKVVFSVPFHAPNASYTIWRAAVTPHNHHIFLWGLSESLPNLTTMLWEFNLQGGLERIYHLPLVRKSESTPSASKLKYLIPWVLGIFVPALHSFVQQNSWMSPSQFSSDPLLAALPSFPLWYCVIICLSGLANSLLAFLIARRCAYTRYGTWAWTFGAFLLGIPGVLLMLSLHPLPVRETCVHCHKKRRATASNFLE